MTPQSTASPITSGGTPALWGGSVISEDITGMEPAIAPDNRLHFIVTFLRSNVLPTIAKTHNQNARASIPNAIDSSFLCLQSYTYVLASNRGRERSHSARNRKLDTNAVVTTP